MGDYLKKLFIDEAKPALDRHSGGGASVEPTLQEKSVTENGEVLPDEGYDGLSKVTVNVPVEEPTLQEKLVTKNGQVLPDSGYDGLSKVIVNVPIPNGYIKPVGSLYITENGYHDVTNYSGVEVNVPIPDGYVEQTQESLEINQNGEYDTSNVKKVIINIKTTNSSSDTGDSVKDSYYGYETASETNVDEMEFGY